MDAELCRKVALTVNSPAWQWLANRHGGKSSDRFQEYRSQFDQACLEAKTFSNLSPELQTSIDTAIKSVDVAAEKFGRMAPEAYSQEQLDQVMLELSEVVDEGEIE